MKLNKKDAEDKVRVDVFDGWTIKVYTVEVYTAFVLWVTVLEINILFCIIEKNLDDFRVFYSTTSLFGAFICVNSIWLELIVSI